MFDSGGNFVKRVATNGPLNAPWGVTQAPSSGFGSFSGDILIGNFFPGGTINAFDPTTNAFLGALTGPNGNPITNDFLWALDFGNGGTGFSSTTLYFTAGVNNQNDGLFGSIQVVPEPGALWLAAAGLLLILGARFRSRGTYRAVGSRTGADRAWPVSRVFDHVPPPHFPLICTVVGSK